MVNDEIHIQEYMWGVQAGEGTLVLVFSWPVFFKSLDFFWTVIGYSVFYDKNQPNKKQMSYTLRRKVNW